MVVLYTCRLIDHSSKLPPVSLQQNNDLNTGAYNMIQLGSHSEFTFGGSEPY